MGGRHGGTGIRSAVGVGTVGLLLAALGAVPAGAVAGHPGGALAAIAPEPPRRPNVVVVMADDMRFDDLQFTPYLRKLARHGVTFDNSFSNFPLCCPARASFLTGQLAHNHHVYWHEPPFGYGSFDDSRTLATSLRAEGYRTGFVGKYLNRYGEDRSRVSGEPSHRYEPRGWSDWYAAIENPGLPGVRGGTYQYFNTAMNINGRLRSHPGVYQTSLFGRYARRLVERYARGRDPFFLYVNYVAPHAGAPVETDDPRGVRDRRGRRVRVPTPARPGWVKGRFDDRITRASGHARTGSPTERNVSDKPGFVRDRLLPTRAEWRAVRELTRQRAESLLVMDREIRRTVARLRRSGEWDETVLVVTSDNGSYLGEHRFLDGKLHGHEPSIRVPLVVTGPGLRDGSHRFVPISTVDLTATILDLASDATPPRRPDGVSRVDTLYGGDRGWSEPVLLESAYRRAPGRSLFGRSDHRRSIGIRTVRYSYIRYHHGFTELYDLARDPHQLRSVAGDPDYRRVRRQLREVWGGIQDCTGPACRPPLPTALAADVDETRRLTRGWLEQHRRRYGFR